MFSDFRDNATSSDTTPPSSPQPTRRSERPSDANVFSRLTSSTAGISDNNSKRLDTVTPVYIGHLNPSPSD